MLCAVWRGIEITFRSDGDPFAVGEADKLGDFFAC